MKKYFQQSALILLFVAAFALAGAPFHFHTSTHHDAHPCEICHVIQNADISGVVFSWQTTTLVNFVLDTFVQSRLIPMGYSSLMPPSTGPPAL